MSRLFDATTEILKSTTFGVPTTTGTLFFWAYPNFASDDDAIHIFVENINNVSGSGLYARKISTAIGLVFGWYVNPTDYRIFVTSYSLNQSAWNIFLLTWNATLKQS